MIEEDQIIKDLQIYHRGVKFKIYMQEIVFEKKN